MALTTNDALLEAWAEQIETIEYNLETLYGPATITPVLPSVTPENGMLEAAAEGTELAAWNFAKMYNYLTTESNSTRIVDVPDTALCCGQIVKIGGQTVVESAELLSAEVTNVISKNTDGSVLQTYPIPAEIQSIEGYGWSAGSVYNYVDFERKVFVKNVGKVVLDGTQNIRNINWQPSDSGVGWMYYYNLTNNAVVGAAPKPNILSNNLPTVSYGTIYTKVVGISAYMSNAAGLVVWTNDTSLTTATAINTYLSANPITVYYELATPIETDISAYITDSDIKVVPGGKLTFDNSNNIDVPSEVKYIS